MWNYFLSIPSNSLQSALNRTRPKPSKILSQPCHTAATHFDILMRFYLPYFCKDQNTHVSFYKCDDGGNEGWVCIWSASPAGEVRLVVGTTTSRWFGNGVNRFSNIEVARSGMVCPAAARSGGGRRWQTSMPAPFFSSFLFFCPMCNFYPDLVHIVCNLKQISLSNCTDVFARVCKSLEFYLSVLFFMNRGDYGYPIPTRHGYPTGYRG